MSTVILCSNSSSSVSKFIRYIFIYSFVIAYFSQYYLTLRRCNNLMSHPRIEFGSELFIRVLLEQLMNLYFDI